MRFLHELAPHLGHVSNSYASSGAASPPLTSAGRNCFAIPACFSTALAVCRDSIWPLRSRWGCDVRARGSGGPKRNNRHQS